MGLNQFSLGLMSSHTRRIVASCCTRRCCSPQHVKQGPSIMRPENVPVLENEGDNSRKMEKRLFFAQELHWMPIFQTAFLRVVSFPLLKEHRKLCRGQWCQCHQWCLTKFICAALTFALSSTFSTAAGCIISSFIKHSFRLRNDRRGQFSHSCLSITIYF